MPRGRIWFVNCRDLKEPGNSWRGPFRVFLEGREITKKTFLIQRFDDGTARLGLYVLDKNECLQLNDDGQDVKTEYVEALWSDIEIQPSGGD